MMNLSLVKGGGSHIAQTVWTLALGLQLHEIKALEIRILWSCNSAQYRADTVAILPRGAHRTSTFESSACSDQVAEEDAAYNAC